MRRVFILALVSFTSIFIISGCNLFSFIEPGTEAEDYLNTGWEYYHDGDFPKRFQSSQKQLKRTRYFWTLTGDVQNQTSECQGTPVFQS